MKSQDYQHMNKNKLIPDLRFPEFKDNSNWKGETIGDVCSILRGSPFAKSQIDNNGINKCIHYGELFTKYNEVIKKVYSKTNVSDGTFSKKGDVLMPSSDVTPSGLAKASALNIENVLLGGDMNILRVKENIDSVYLSYFLNNNKKHILKLVTGSIIKHIYASDIEALPLLFPLNKDEQQKIADCLTSLDEVIIGHEDRLVTLQDHKKGLMQNLFPQEGKTKPKFRFPEFKNEKDWDIVQFNKYITLYRGSSPRPIANYLTKDEDGVNWIKIGDTSKVNSFLLKEIEERITIEGARSSRPVYKGEIILANSMSYGKAYELAVDGCIYDGWFVLRNFEEKFNKQYLLQLLNSDYMQNQYAKLAAGGIVKNISSEIVNNTNLLRPKILEQQKIADCLTSLDELIEEENSLIKQLKQHKLGLMQGLFPKIEE